MMGRRIEVIAFDTTYYPFAFASCAFFLCIYKYVSPSLSLRMCEGYRNMPLAKQIDWNTRVNSTLHSAIVSCMCVYSLVYDNEISEDPIWCDAPMVRTSCAILFGYMASDLVVMTVHYKHIGETFYFFHHGASMYAYYYVTTYGVLSYFANYRLMAEFSTAFVNQRWFFDVLRYPKNSPLFIGNGLAMTAAFFLARIAVMPSYWSKVYSVYGTEDFARIGHIQGVLIVTCVILDVMNIFWFYKMCLGVKKVLTILLKLNTPIEESRPAIPVEDKVK
ncbi:TLC domain-containing protein 4-B-like [Haliotis cracherodii]|uniref:TLC domain-containing protein 4-B-like n=1 Tax=Haliotis rufescens TaxID=6454 RepID=UPI001EB07A32|nr:TLC domain-containing protein 4-B-like [Haliotis rufescens]XP_046332595.1 TLC domain-containing protein 4-B-like [Haliotis rufescens]